AHGTLSDASTLKNFISFSVSDTGIGIPKDKQELIFEAFQQADGTTNRKYGGTGLGLTISREIANLLGGSIYVESTPDVGSTFTLYLPEKYTWSEAALLKNKNILEPAMEIPPLPLGADFSGNKVLVVDDDPRNIFAIRSVLEERKIEVISAENGKIAIEVLEANRDTDLILMDTMMPEMNGLEAIEFIRQLNDLKNIPIISLTAKAMKGDREKCLEAGASDYITKPVESEKLLSLMYIWLHKKEVQVA
ncbi:MAG: putative SigmaB asociated two-component system sensor protein, partial [Bacteriovoracaceae bacterium]|nr:putative SigmaB asociated two-component system sensor protein [Bacteriovoracaceae bacterium]